MKKSGQNGTLVEEGARVDTGKLVLNPVNEGLDLQECT